MEDVNKSNEGERLVESYEKKMACYYYGYVRHYLTSRVALSICDGIVSDVYPISLEYFPLHE